ncbi:MAG TPA: hypothetical protein VK743_21325 [Steroidobacteraceae bacterium]|jgi:hypothetical protein|nr:hypothetical protein [Steroidobacteraceae bacterium]
MKTVLILICIAAIASPCSTAAVGQPSFGPTTDNSVSRVALDGPAPVAQRARAKQSTLKTQGNLDGFRGTVVKEMRATKAFVKENVVKQESVDRKLMLLAAIGMIVLQLRRKHKSLPQRQIAPYA